ncbi:hypothetical protein DRO97_02660 [Archaeoglobales archaeon]|nr:MAG: hypothetical protein DRO97_02660 [Archaeoglobales archaeon]
MYSYNIHNKVKITSKLRGVIPALHNYFWIPNLISEPDIVIDVKNVDLCTHEYNRYDLWFYGTKNTVYYKDDVFWLKDRVLFTENINKTYIIFSKDSLKLNRASRGPIYDLIETVIEYKLLNHNMMTIHGAAIAKDDNCVILAGYPNIGKTLFTLNLLNRGYSYMADDTSLISTDGTVYAYPTYSSIGYHDFLSFIKPSDIGYLNYLKYLPKTWFLSKFKLAEKFFNYPEVFLPEILGSKIKDKAKCKLICLLGIGKTKIEELSIDEAVDKIMIINKYSMPQIIDNPVLQTYFYVNGMDIFSIVEKQRKIIRNFLKDVKIREITVSKDDVNKISDIIDMIIDGEENIDLAKLKNVAEWQSKYDPPIYPYK